MDKQSKSNQYFALKSIWDKNYFKEIQKFIIVKYFTPTAKIIHTYCYKQTDNSNQYPIKYLMTETYETC